MRNFYMAIWYQCNQRCTGCPISKNPNKHESMSYEMIRQKLDELQEVVSIDDRISVTVSGGEPTLHPDFFRILDLFNERDYYVTLLTNAERFSDSAFCFEFLKHIDIRKFVVVTTLHGSCAQLHESQNRSVGSFEKSVNALKFLSFRGVKVSVKHCITGQNYRDTQRFISFVDENFHPSVDIQLWGIDYSGLSKEEAARLYVPFADMRDDLEAALDTYLEIRNMNYRNLSLNNIPLCAIDPYYWDLMPTVTDNGIAYTAYLDPTHQTFSVQDDSGKLSKRCHECDLAKYCQGAYRSLFEYFGDDVVEAIKEIE